MKLSIIIPVFNTPNEYLVRCLESIKNQKESDFEVIIVDDGSLSKTAKLLDNYAQDDNRFKVFHKENEGVSKARNYGIEQAAGEFITFVDADDYVDCNMISDAFKIQKKYDADMVMWQFDYIVDDKEVIAPYRGNKIDIFDDLNKDVLLEMVLYEDSYHERYCWRTLIAVSCKIYRMELVKEIRFPEKVKINEDRLYVFNVIQKCHRFVVTDKVLYHYVQWSGSACHAFRPENVNDLIQSRQEFMKLIKANDCSQKIYHAYNMHALFAVRFVLFKIWNNLDNNKIYTRKDFSEFVKQPEIRNSVKELNLKKIESNNSKIILILLKLHLFFSLKILIKLRIKKLEKEKKLL